MSNTYIDGMEELKALAEIINDSIASIESTVASKGLRFPSSSTAMTMQSEEARLLPDVERRCSLIISAATQLACTVRSPMHVLVTATLQHAVPVALGVAATANVAEICREAGPQGAHVNDIGRTSGLDPSKLARLLRVLVTNHIFTETAPDVFANNRVSSALDSGLPVQQILANPEEKYMATMGVTAGLEHCVDDGLKAQAYLRDTLFDPKLGMSQEINETALNMAFKTDLPMFEWFNTEEAFQRGVRFRYGSLGTKQTASPNAILEGFDWKGLKKGALVVDVGGGVGHQSMTLLQHHEHLRFVVQDRMHVLKDATEFWNSQMPGVLLSGRVVLQDYNFLTPQPVKDADVFLLRNILHDWPDKYCLQILKHLREAASPGTQLLVVDNLMSYAAAENTQDIPGANRPAVSSPLLPNGGYANIIPYYQDIQMMATMQGKERTLTEIRKLMVESGWNLVQVYHGTAFGFTKVIGIPA